MQKENLKFDVIIVGGGSAGAVLANRLTEEPRRSVLLVEAGTAYDAWNYPKRIASSDLLGVETGADWGYTSEPGVVGHRIQTVRGKVLGGSSAINAACAMRPRAQDIANWNLPDWSYDGLLQAIFRVENSDVNGSALHSHDGLLPIRRRTLEDLTPMQRAFVKSAAANGLALVAEWEPFTSNATGPIPLNAVNGVRINTGMAYLSNDVRRRPNLKIVGDCMVDRVLIEDGRGVGIKLADGNDIHGGEVILSAGVYGSAPILLRSGIGPADELRRLTIAVVADLPVGKNLKDQPFYFNTYAARPEKIGAQEPSVGALAWFHSSLADSGDEDLHISASHHFPPDKSPTGVGFALAVGLTRPKSIGRVWIESRDPSVAPRIDLNFLAEANDRVRLLEGVRLSRQIAKTTPLADLIDSELSPGQDALEDNEVEASIFATVDAYHHAVASAPMGNPGDSRAVVDSQGRVFGVDGLSVIDASIIPDAISVATNITTMAIAEQLSTRYL